MSGSSDVLTKRQELGHRSRERILDAAERLVAERGYAATSISMIAKSSGLPPSSIYWHFSSKEELLGAVVERGARRWLRNLPRWDSFGGDLGAYLGAVGRNDAAPEFLRLLMQVVLEGPENARGGARGTMEHVWNDVRASLERVMAEHLELGRGAGDRALAARLARFVLACTDGAYIDTHIDPGTAVREIYEDLAIALQAIADAHKSGS